MKVISLWQPWATLMAAGFKRIETRSWAPRGLKPGQLIAIHAAKRWDDEEFEMLLEDAFFRRYLTLAQRRGLWDFDKPPLGCLVAVARFDHVEPITADTWRRITQHEHAFGNYGPYRYGWVFSAVRPLQPIPFRGQQGLFNTMPPAEIRYLEPRNEAKALVMP